MFIAPVPDARDIAELVETREVPPEPEVIVTEVAPVALPNVLILAPVVARVVAPTDVNVVPACKVVVVANEPGVVIAAGKLRVIDPTPAVEVIWLPVPAI